MRLNNCGCMILIWFVRLETSEEKKKEKQIHQSRDDSQASVVSRSSDEKRQEKELVSSLKQSNTYSVCSWCLLFFLLIIVSIIIGTWIWNTWMRWSSWTWWTMILFDAIDRRNSLTMIKCIVCCNGRTITVTMIIIMIESFRWTLNENKGKEKKRISIFFSRSIDFYSLSMKVPWLDAMEEIVDENWQYLDSFSADCLVE